MAPVAANDIKYGNKKDGFKYIREGEDVSKGKLGLDDDQWKALLAGGSVVASKDDLPAPTPESTSEQIEGKQSTPTNTEGGDDEGDKGTKGAETSASGGPNPNPSAPPQGGGQS